MAWLAAQTPRPALAMAEQAVPAARHSGPRSYTLLTGFEETEAIDPDAVHVVAIPES